MDHPDDRADAASAVTPRRSGLGSPRVVWSAFGASIGVNLLAVVLYPLWLGQIQPVSVAFLPPAVPAGADGIEVIRIAPGEPTPEVVRPEEPEEIAVVAAPRVDLRTQTFGDERPVVELRRPGLSAAERLRPALTDRRLWAPLPPEMRTLTLEQREELLIAGRLSEWNDSVAAAAAAEAAWRDWTFTDADGNRWGVSDGQLHLGGITLPLPFAFDAGPAGRDYMRQFNELARQGANAQVQQSVRERMEAIRARRDRERAAAQADTTGTSR